MNKKILSISLVFVVLLILAGFAGYKYAMAPEMKVENEIGDNNTEVGDTTTPNDQESQNPQIIVDPSIDIEATGQNGGGALMVCMDQCGNGVCQPANPECEKDASKCTCAEDKASCPEDCK